MHRIVAFGCSNTYGQGLPDCYVDNGRGPSEAGDTCSKYAYPQVIANRLGYDCVNLGVPGGSNRIIWHNIINFDFQPNDLVIMYWTYIDRYASITESRTVNLGMWSSMDPLCKAWQKYNAVARSVQDRLLESLVHIDHANKYIQSKNIKHMNMKTSRNDLKDTAPDWCTFKWDVKETEDLMVTQPLALDGLHMGSEAHQVIADRVIAAMFPNLGV